MRHGLFEMGAVPLCHKVYQTPHLRYPLASITLVITAERRDAAAIYRNSGWAAFLSTFGLGSRLRALKRNCEANPRLATASENEKSPLGLLL